MLFACLFQYFEEKEYQTESKQNETFGRVIFGTEAIQETCFRSKNNSPEGFIPFGLRLIFLFLETLIGKKIAILGWASG